MPNRNHFFHQDNENQQAVFQSLINYAKQGFLYGSAGIMALRNRWSLTAIMLLSFASYNFLMSASESYKLLLNELDSDAQSSTESESYSNVITRPG